MEVPEVVCPIPLDLGWSGKGVWCPRPGAVCLGKAKNALSLNCYQCPDRFWIIVVSLFILRWMDDFVIISRRIREMIFCHSQKG